LETLATNRTTAKLQHPNRSKHDVVSSVCYCPCSAK